MLRRRLTVALLLLATLSAAGLSPGLRAASSNVTHPRSASETATGDPALKGVEPAVARVKLDDRRQVSAQRLATKAGVWLVAVLVLLAGLLPGWRRRVPAGRLTASVQLAWWSPISGRDPPSSLLPA